MNGIMIETKEKLSELVSNSFKSPVVLFKHSTRCSISSMVLNRMRSGPKNIDVHVLDIIAHRDLSNEIAQHFDVMHQSPQLLIIHQGKSVFDISHMGISPNAVTKQLELLG